jgi:DNA processing protein
VLQLGSPQEVWERIAAGSIRPGGPISGRLTATWRAQAGRTDVKERWWRYRRAGIGIAGFASAAYPDVLTGDPEPPAVLFIDGDLRSLALPRVAVVGTRQCTHYGSDVAFGLGRDLAAAGVCVVSGLALGIDGAAHAGALDATVAAPVAVVAGGLDRVYPPRNRQLWRAVAATGAVLSEAPLGVAPDRWRFPARNRIIAALSDVVIVVESDVTGGSMHTVAEAARRDIPVMAVPGPIRSARSAGTNRLLAEGCAPVCGVDDVLVLLGLSAAATLRRGARPAPSAAARRVLDAFCWQPVDLELLVQRTDLSVGDVAFAVEELLSSSWIARRGAWLERVAGE